MVSSGLSWVDFTRRNDPACQAGLELLLKKLNAIKRGLCPYPKVFCFWTKAPAVVAELYLNAIQEMEENNTLVLAQVTLNNYDGLEFIADEKKEMNHLVELLGEDQIRLRFDPIIVGYTTQKQYESTLEIAVKYNIKRIITNFLVPGYKGVGRLLCSKGYNVINPGITQKTEILGIMLDMAQKSGVELAVCAETADMVNHLPGLKKASCSDATWAINLRHELAGEFTFRPSRQGCGCCYSADWGVYRNQGGYACPHQCLYCYAK